MKKRIKKIISTWLLALTLAGAGGSIASAATVYYKGSAVYWNYGRTVRTLELLTRSIWCV